MHKHYLIFEVTKQMCFISCGVMQCCGVSSKQPLHFCVLKHKLLFKAEVQPSQTSIICLIVHLHQHVVMSVPQKGPTYIDMPKC